MGNLLALSLQKTLILTSYWMRLDNMSTEGMTYWKGCYILRHLGVKTQEKGLAAKATRLLLDIIGREGQSSTAWLRVHRVKGRTVVFWVSPAYPMSSRTPITRTEQMCYKPERKAGSLCSQGADNLTAVQRQHWTRLTWWAIIWKLGCFQFMVSVCLNFYSGGEEHPKANSAPCCEDYREGSL